MQTESFFTKLLNSLNFPFEDPHWVKKVAIGSGLSIASFIVPIIPMLFVYGYSLRIMQRIISGDGKPALPEWKDWGKLFTDGLKLWGAGLLYTLPILVLVIAGMAVILLVFLMPAYSVSGSGTPPPQNWALFAVGFMVLVVMILILGVLSLAITLLQAAGLSHLAAKDSFAAAFRFGEWWPVFKKGFVAFLLAVVVSMVLVWVLSLAMQILLLTVILAILLPLVMGIYAFLILVYQNTFYALAYRDTVQKMGASA